MHLECHRQLDFLGQVGYSRGDGKTPNQDVSETNPGVGAGASYQLNGIGTASNWNLGNTINTTPTPGGVPVAFSWIFGDQNTRRERHGSVGEDRRRLQDRRRPLDRI